MTWRVQSESERYWAAREAARRTRVLVAAIFGLLLVGLMLLPALPLAGLP